MKGGGKGGGEAHESASSSTLVQQVRLNRASRGRGYFGQVREGSGGGGGR